MTTPTEPAGRSAEGRGRGRKGRGGGRGGRGRGSGLSAVAIGDASKSDAAANAPSSNKGSRSRSRGGRGGGGDAKNAASNNKGKQQQRNNKGVNNKAPPGPSPEEIIQKEEALRQEKAAQELKERLEQEEKAKQAAAKLRQQKQKQLEAELLQARDTLQSMTDALVQRQSGRAAMQPDVLAAARKEFESSKKNLMTDLKKCTAFVKKIKSGSAWSMRPSDVSKDIQTLNLSRYVEEVVAAILESKPKVSDLPVVLAFCSAMHQRYPQFLSNLVPGLWAVTTSNTSRTPETAKLRRLYLRLLTEFCLWGLVTDTKALVKCITEASGGNNIAKDAANPVYVVQDANLLVAFAKAASPDMLGVTPQSVQDALALIQKQTAAAAAAAAAAADNSDDQQDVILVSPALLHDAQTVAEACQTALSQLPPRSDAAQTLSQHCLGAYQTLATSLLLTHRKLQKLEKRCEQDRLLSGALTEAREKGLTDARKLKESLQNSVEAMSDVLAQPMPHLEEDHDDAGQDAGRGVEVWTKGVGEGEEDFGPFDDEETRAFYCDIPDMLTTIPPALLGMSPQEIERRKAESAKKYGTEEGETVEEEEPPMDVTPTPEAQLDAEEEETPGGSLHHDSEDEGMKEEGEADKDTPHYRLMVLLEQELPECHRREQIDEITERFCTNNGSSKNSRKRLMKTLFLVPHSRLDLLPFYSRMAATLDRVWGEMGPGLVTELEQQFHGQTKFKKNQNIESRMRTARYIGELTKFRVAPPIVFLRCMKRCLEDFTGANVDVACSLLESAGRFLFRLRYTSARVADLLETMTRLSKAKHLDERLQSLIKASYYSVKPPPAGPRKRVKEYPPMEAYLRHLLLVRLSHSNSSASLLSKQIARLPWSDPLQQCGALVCRLMMKACRKGHYKTIEAIAMVASNLRTQRTAGEATVRLVDAVLEELRWALEFPDFRDQQRTLTYARLLGELYCSSQVPAHVVLTQLYDFINVGHEIPEALREASKKLASELSNNVGATDDSQLPVYNSASGVSQTIQEDEEMEETELETKDEGAPPEKPQPVAVSEHSRYDPRVPSPQDPPNSAYRIKLVCTLLEVVSKQITSRNNLPRVKGFLSAFQRYLFTKSMLPTDVEFSLLDTFDILDSEWRRLMASSRNADTKETGFPRFATWLEAHNATVAIEESEALFEQQQRAKLAAGMDGSRGGGNSLVDDDSASMLDDDEDAFLSLSAKDSVSEGIEEEDMDHEVDDGEPSHSSSENDENEDEDTDSEGSINTEDEEEFDEEEHMRQLEEEAFERELRRATMDALEKGKNASRKMVADYMPMGSQIIKKKQPNEGSRVGEAAEVSAPGAAIDGKAGICFQVLRKGNKGKVDAKELIVPTDSNLAMVATKQDDEAARERDVIKQRVLQYEAESAEAEYSGGNVYLEQEKLQVIRNRPLSMAEIDKNFGTTGGNLRTDKPMSNQTTSGSGRGGRAPGGSARGRGGGRGRGRSSSSGRTLF